MDLLKNGIAILALILLGSSAFAGPTPADSVPAILLASAPKIGSGGDEWKKSERLLVYFWATWCPDCREKLAGPLAALAERTGSPVVLVATDKDADKIRAYLEDQKVKLSSVHDESRELRKAFRAFSVPSWAVIEKKNDTYIILGQEAGSDLAKIEKLLKGGG